MAEPVIVESKPLGKNADQYKEMADSRTDNKGTSDPIEPVVPFSYLRAIRMPGYAAVYLTMTPTGDIVCTGFWHGQNYAEDANGWAEIPVMLIKNPLSESPEFLQVCTNRFPPKRGYSGVAVDADGNYFVAADTGDPKTCWIRKYTPDGKQAVNFGIKGEITGSSRYLGLACSGKYIFTTAAFGVLQIYSAEDGKLIGQKRMPPVGMDKLPNVREIALDGDSQNIYGVAQGGILVWEGGTPANPDKYQLRRITHSAGPLVGSEGITFDPSSQSIIHPLQAQRALRIISKEGTVDTISLMEFEARIQSIADAMVLSDGQTLVISDPRTEHLHLLKRNTSKTPSAEKP